MTLRCYPAWLAWLSLYSDLLCGVKYPAHSYSIYLSTPSPPSLHRTTIYIRRKMPTIEVLPSSSTSSGPNWTYSNLPPALAHRNSLPTATSRVRATRTNNTENSAARQRQINSRILELERGDNYRDIHIPVPARKGAASGSRCKPSPSILSSPLLSTLAFSVLFIRRAANTSSINTDEGVFDAECATGSSVAEDVREPPSGRGGTAYGCYYCCCGAGASSGRGRGGGVERGRARARARAGVWGVCGGGEHSAQKDVL